MRWLDISVLLRMCTSIGKEKNDSSSGYVRVEARDRKCRVEVHLRCVGLEPGSRCRVYGFVRQEGLMDGILIGNCVTGRERIECALETDTGDIGGMGKSLQELGGLLLISDAGGFWGTEWDDQPIRPENFREWKKKETEPRKETEKTGTEYQKTAEKKGREREEKEEENQKDGTLPEVQENQKESDRIMTVEEIQEDVLKTSETGNSYQAPGPHPPEPPRPGQPSPHPPEPPRPGQPSPHPPELPRPGQPSPHPPKPSRPEPSRPLPGIPCDDPFNDGLFHRLPQDQTIGLQCLMQKKRLLLQQPFCHVRISEFRPSSAVQKSPGTVHTGSTRWIQPAGTVYGQYVWLSLL